MDKELIVQGSPTRVEIALVEDQKLVELHQQKTKTNFSVGDIFLGKIKKIMPSLNAVFVDIGHRKLIPRKQLEQWLDRQCIQKQDVI